MSTGILTWSQTAASNASASTNIGWAEGQSPAGVNDSARAMMAEIAEMRDDWAGVKPSNAVITSDASGNAIAVTTNGQISAAALTNGWTITFRVITGTNTGSTTFAPDSLTAKQLRTVTGTALPAGYLKVGGVYTATYFQPLDQWILHGSYGREAAVEFIIDGGGSTITTGVKGFVEVPFDCKIIRNTLTADQSGSIVIDVWSDTYANFPPTVADTITASAKPTLSSAQKSQDTTLTGWTTTIPTGNWLGFNVDSVTTCTRVTLSLKVVTTV